MFLKTVAKFTCEHYFLFEPMLKLTGKIRNFLGIFIAIKLNFKLFSQIFFSLLINLTKLFLTSIKNSKVSSEKIPLTHHFLIQKWITSDSKNAVDSKIVKITCCEYFITLFHAHDESRSLLRESRKEVLVPLYRKKYISCLKKLWEKKSLCWIWDFLGIELK